MTGYAALPVEDPCHEAGTISPKLKLASWDSGFFQLARRYLLETCVLAFLYAIFAFCFSFRSAPHQPIGYSQLPEDLRHSFEEVKSFTPNPVFSGYTNRSAAAWESLMPSKTKTLQNLEI
ncbi:hypothetical protein LY78DRAFT_683895 [Colletotrichum sublineola]|nr:hypothetical protein LY78DRAFT_683895 [Colletotrichum sublineola]